MSNQVYYWPVPDQLIDQAKRPLVLVTGVFDLLHHAHLDFLQAAAKLGQSLWVGLESDLRVSQIKGDGRPINPANVRAQNIINHKIADVVFVLPEEFSQPSDHLALLRQLRPEFLAVSSHTAHLPAKRRLMQRVGGQVVVVKQQDPTVSTSQLLQKKARL